MGRRMTEEDRRQKIADELRKSAGGLPSKRVHGYDVFFEEGPDGVSCFCPTLPGCVSAGESLTDCRRNMGEAIELHLEGMRADGDPVPPRDGRSEPRPDRVKGRTVTISSRVSPEVAEALERISKAKGITKTESVELAILSLGKKFKV